MNNSEFNAKYDGENCSITGSIIAQIVKEEDEYAMNIIEQYVKTKQSRGEIIAAKIIPEGKLRHIINLGLTVYNKDMKLNELVATDLFPQEQYIEFLRRQLMRCEQQNQKLRNQLNMEKENLKVSKDDLKQLINNYYKDKQNVKIIRNQMAQILGLDTFQLLIKIDKVEYDVLDYNNINDSIVDIIIKSYNAPDMYQEIFDFLIDMEYTENIDAFDELDKLLQKHYHAFGGTLNEK